MKLLVLAHRVPFPPNKGEKIRTYHQLVHLRNQGARITLATLEHEPSDADSQRQLAEQHGIECLPGSLKPAWWRHARSLLLGLPMSVGYFHSEPLHRRVETLLRESSFDAVLCTGSSMAQYVKTANTTVEHDTSVVSELGATRLLMDFMDLDSDKWRQYQAAKGAPMSWVYAREARLLARLEADVQRRFDSCFFISDNEAQMFGRALTHLPGSAVPDNVKVVPNGVDTQYYSPGIKTCSAKPPTLLFTGVMDYYPNVDAMCYFAKTSWPDIQARYPGARLVIAGMNPAPEIQALNRLPGVQITGFVEDMRTYLHEADLFIAPFRLARGVQNKTLQALAVGLPVVTTQLGAEGIEVEPGRHLLIGETADELTDRVTQLVDNPSLYAELRTQGMQLVRERYAWQSCIEPLRQALFA